MSLLRPLKRLSSLSVSLFSEQKEALLFIAAWVFTLLLSLSFWHHGDDEVQLPFNMVNLVWVLALYLVFFLAMMRLHRLQYAADTRHADTGLTSPVALLQKQRWLALALVMVAFCGLAAIFYWLMLGLLFALLTAQLLETMPARWAWGIALVTPLLAGCYDVLVKGMGFYPEIKVLFMVINALVLMVQQKAHAEHQQKEQNAHLLRELRATQQLLASSAKQDERLRIARDLHDDLGHQLTALGLQLELAANVPAEQIPEKIQRAKFISSGLLDAVRVNVSELRDNRESGLVPAIRTLLQDLPKVTFEFHCDCQENRLSHRQTQVLFHCTQEAVTNVLRHSGATAGEIELTTTPQQAILRVRDNGGALQSPPSPGNGLQGMAERVALMDGHLTYSNSELGFELQVTLPLH